MIIVKIFAGLGNQMFHYALGRHSAILNRTELKLDITGFDNYKFRRYGLNNYNIKADIATLKEIRKLKTNKLFAKVGFIKRSHIIEKPGVVFDENILKLRGDYYLDGCWETEKYFRDIEDIIKDDFKVRKEPLGKNKEILDQIINSNSVSIHIRRGDYLCHPEIYNTFGLEYYQQAAQFIAQKINNPHFFIFSDDMPWVKKNLKLDFPATYVDQNNDNTNYEDIRLMSLCKHNINANSSFSWWGAWLNKNQNKIVISPKKLINLKNFSNKDSIPNSWIRM